MSVRQASDRLGELGRYYAAQAGWTRATRSYLYRRAGLMRARTILEVGCGTGEITEELAGRTKARITAVDIDRSMVERTRERVPSAEVTTADAADLDFHGGSFDAAVCHFALMWCSEPDAVVSEMARVVRSSGCVIALSEPDYGGALEYPCVSGYSQLVAEGLRRRGADPETGRKLGCFFSQVPLETDIGLASTVWTEKEMQAGIDACMWLVRDVAATEELAEMADAYAAALSAGGFAFFLPVFWAFGLKK